jgi:hypothetical protein
MSKLPRLARLLLGVMLGTAFALVLGEIAVRAFGLASPPTAVTLDRARFNDFPGVHFPASSRVDRSRSGLHFAVRINAQGFRGPDVLLAKPEGEKRIVLLGDSFAWGQFVDDSATLPAQLEATLAARCRNTRVLNLALPGSSIDAQRDMLERALPLQPDAIVLVHHDNDVVDMRRPTLWEQLEESRELKSAFPMSLVYPVLRRLALWSLLRDARTRMGAVERRRRADAPLSQHALPDIDSLRSRYAEQYAAFAARVAALDVPLLVTAYPSHNALADRNRTTFGWFEDLARARGDRYADLHTPLRASGLPDSVLYLLPRDGHASARGYALASTALAASLLSAPDAARYCEAR